MKELYSLLNEGCSFEMSEDQPMIAQFRVRLNLIDEIKAAQESDPVMKELKEKVQAGQEQRFQVYQGVLKLNGRLCVPDVLELKQKILHEAHYAPYNVHPGATKMYHDILPKPLKIHT